MKKRSYSIDITAVAKVAGVSAATVSRVLNHPDLVKDSTRKRVDAAIRKTGYIRNRAAQSMHGRRSATLGLVLPTVNYSIFAELVQSFNDAVSDLGFTLLLATHGYDLKVEYQVLRKLLEHRVDGIALIGFDHSRDTFRLLASQKVPVVAAWNYAPDSPVSCIGADNAEAGAVAARHLLSLGHRRIGFIFPPTAENDRARDRMQAAIATLRSAGQDVSENSIARAQYSIADSKAVCLELLHPRPPFTALLCGNDIIAQGVLSAAQQLGLRVPEDLSVIGIGDFPGSADMFPALTTVAIPAREIGARAGRHLVDIIGHFDATQITRTKVAVTLKHRATTRSPSSDPALT